MLMGGVVFGVSLNVFILFGLKVVYLPCQILHAPPVYLP